MLINNKKRKVKHIFTLLGENPSVEDFSSLFKTLYPNDWKKLNERYDAGIPDVPEPNVYLMEMYRNNRK